MTDAAPPHLHPAVTPERTLRRLPLAARRRRPRLLRALLGRSLRVVLLGSVALAFGGWLRSSPVFALREVSIEGGRRVPRSWIEHSLDDWRGANVLLLDLRDVEARLRTHRWIRAVELHKRLPDGLAVEVLEHHPAALLVLAEHAHYVSDEGILIAPADPDEGRLLVLRLGEIDADELVASSGAPDDPGAAVLRRALGVATALESSALQWAGGASEVLLVSDQDFQVTLRGLAFPLVVREDTPPHRIAAFERLLPLLERELGALRLADLRFTRRLVLQPQPVREAELAAVAARGADALPPPFLSSARRTSE